jgi:hypothetical protein
MAYTSPNITASGTTFAQLQSGGLSGHLERLITANKAASNAPTSAPTLAASGSGNTLPAGTYYVVFTETDGSGETTASPVSSSQAVTYGQQLSVTFPGLQTGNTARNTYVGTASTGPFLLAATGTTAGSLNLTAPLPSNSYAVKPPAVNTTAFAYTDSNGIVHSKVLEYLRLFEDGRGNRVYLDLRETVGQFLRGEPLSFGGAIEKLRHAHTVFAMLNTLCAEIGTLIDANPGTLTTAATGIGSRKAVRTQP